MSELINAIKAVESGGTFFSGVASEVLFNYVKELDEAKEPKLTDEFETLSLREREVFQGLAEGKLKKKEKKKKLICPQK